MLQDNWSHSCLPAEKKARYSQESSWFSPDLLSFISTPRARGSPGRLPSPSPSISSSASFPGETYNTRFFLLRAVFLPWDIYSWLSIPTFPNRPGSVYCPVHDRHYCLSHSTKCCSTLLLASGLVSSGMFRPGDGPVTLTSSSRPPGLSSWLG